MKKYLLMGFAALALITYGCNRDNASDPDGGNGQLQGYVTLAIQGSSTTRTAGTPTEDGTGAENVVSNVTVVFTDATGVISASKTPSITAGVTESFKIDVGTHYVYALVNATGITMNLTVGQNIQQVLDVAADKFATGYNNGSFLMVNEHNSASAQAGVQVTVSSDNVISNPATATIKVDRVAVKIEDKTTTPTITDLTTKHPFITAVTVNGFAILNVNKQVNLVQKWGTENPRNTSVPTLDYEVLQTPVYADGALVASQYHKNIGDYTTLSAGAITDLTQGQSAPYVTSIYAIENRPTMSFFNTPATPTAGRGETTGVIYKVTTTPSTTFYVYKDVVYSDLATIDALPEFDSEDLTLLSVPQLRGKGIKVYEDGVMYYTYFIKDPNVAHQYNGDDYYGVFRNSIYNLSVNSLTDLGDDVPGGGKVDPTDPDPEKENPEIDSDEAYIKVTVVVNPWILNTIGIDF